MSDNITRLGKNIRSLKTSPQFDGYTKVVIDLNDDYSYIVGTDEGRTLTLENPWATRAMADNLLKSIRGFQYQPYSAPGAILDPAAEIGDGITAGGIYGGIYRQKITFGRSYRADLSAPGDEEINHEFPYKPKQDRKVRRQLAELSSELNIQADKITAKVSRTGGDASSFGWELDESSWIIKANGVDVLKAAKGGLEIYGKITATSGKIGGFDIENGALSTNGHTIDGTNTTGIYIGPSGIRMGRNFKVDVAGNLTAYSGKFTGTVYAGSIQHGSTGGYMSGAGISAGSMAGNRLQQNTITTAYTSGGINTSLGFANFADSVFNGYDRADYIDTKVLMIKGVQFVKKTISFKDYYGNTRTFYVLAMAEE